MKKFSIMYGVFRSLTVPAIRIFYKQIQIKNFENLTKPGAVFICSNHVNAFMDPVSVQLHTRRQIFSLARGDAFSKPFMRWLFTQWKLIPIYRLSEGAENLKKNNSTFSMSAQVLSKGNPLVIYPEAICVQERRIRKLKKGAARIAFDVEEQSDFKANLLILPLGLTYSNPKKFRSKLFINFGEPITATKYSELYKTDKAKAINELTADIEKAMKELVVNIQHKENDQLVEDLYIIYKEQLILDLGLDPENLEDDFKVSRYIVDAVNYFQNNDPVLVETVKQQMDQYIKTLNEFDLRDHLLTKEGLRTITDTRVTSDIVTSIIGMPLFLLGLVMNYLPYKLAHTSAKKLAKEVEFHASINMIIGWFAWIVYYLLQLLIVGLVFRNWSLLTVYAVLVPLTGLFALRFYPLLKKAAGRRRLLRLKENNKTEFKGLVSRREEMIKLLDSAKQKYYAILKSI
jgi:glycerol-3-phosphate O-acyltransferase/dihydroxyacetone phosphate acyltransferase